MLAVWCLAIGTSCREASEPPLIVLLAVDGATPETIDRLRSQGKLPNIDRLMRTGASGPMESLAAKRRLQPKPRRGYWSPIVWASMATGKVPDKHGIVDFLLPVRGTSSVWMGDRDGPPHAELHLPGLSGEPPLELHIRLRSYPPNGAQEATITMNGTPIGSVEVETTWTTFTTPIPNGAIRPVRNTLGIALSRQSRPSDHGASKDRRDLAAGLQRLWVTDAGGTTVVDFDPIYQRFDLGHGFYQPEAKVVEAQSAHMRSKPVWDLLGDAGHPVGVVGYWNTWPAYPVNGFLVSSHLGVRGERQGVNHDLTWPAELADDIRALAPDNAAIARLTTELYPDDCAPIDPKDEKSFERILWQDAFYFRIARKLLPTLERGFFTVYFELIDASGHLFLPLASGAPLPEGCPEETRLIVDKTYEQLDAWVGELVEDLPEHATIILASDHGMAPGGERGFHAPFGIFVARGPGFRVGAETRGTTILDIAPTILYVAGESIPLDLDGGLAVSSFDESYLSSHPPRYVDVETSLDTSAIADEGVPEELIERLRTLGYLQ